MEKTPQAVQHYDAEKMLHPMNGLAIMLLNIVLICASIAGIIILAVLLDGASTPNSAPAPVALFVVGIVICALYCCLIGPILFCGIKVLKPNEALVLTLFGIYYGTIAREGIFFVNPFVSAINPAAHPMQQQMGSTESPTLGGKNQQPLVVNIGMGKKISLKAMTLSNEKQKINDQLGNPIIIGIVVIWKVVNTAKAVFNVDNYREFLSIQCDSALRNIVRCFPYDVSENGDEQSLRGSSQDIAQRLKEEIQQQVGVAGLEICEARITNLAYAPEIAAVMLQRQQASAIIDARKMIVEGAVGMVEMALTKLGEKELVKLDDERRAQMVTNLLVVLCGNRDAQPIVNSGSIY